jgi:hypothetical protein
MLPVQRVPAVASTVAVPPPADVDAAVAVAAVLDAVDVVA